MSWPNTFLNQQISSAFQGSYFLPVQVPATVSKAEVETWVSNLATNGYLTGFDFSSTAFNFMLPKGTILTHGQDTSQDGLGGFHGSVHVTSSDGRPATLYYVVGVYSEIRSNGQTNGIPAFDQSWKDVAATFYHELNEVRTDPDGEDAGRTGNPSFFGWLSQQGEECGDFPLSGAYSPAQVFQEVPLTNGRGDCSSSVYVLQRSSRPRRTNRNSTLRARFLLYCLDRSNSRKFRN